MLLAAAFQTADYLSLAVRAASRRKAGAVDARSLRSTTVTSMAL